MDKLARHSALADAVLERSQFTLREAPSIGLICLQAFFRRVGVIEELAERLDIRLPLPGEVFVEQGMRFHWAGPGEWIIAVLPAREKEVVRRWRDKLLDLPASVSIISDSKVVLDLSGPALWDILARGSSVDFHPAHFEAGSCVNTRFASVPVTLSCFSAGDSVSLIADSSYSAYLLSWFEAASVPL